MLVFSKIIMQGKRFMEKKEGKTPVTFSESVGIFTFLIVIIIVGNIKLGIRIEILLITASAFVLALGIRHGYGWLELERAISKRLADATPAILIIWVIGMVTAAMMFSGTIPMFIYFGLKIINPKMMYLCSFLLCAILSLCTGSSWGSAATGGVAVMGIAAGLGMNLPINAAAAVGGCIVGDKLSPLSDTTNLAPLAAGTDLYAHIRSMLWTTLPAGGVAAFIYFILGLKMDVGTLTELPEMTVNMMNDLKSVYNWNIIVLVPFVIIIGGAFLKKSAVLSMVAASLTAVLIGTFYQGFDFVKGLNSCINGFTVDMITSNECCEEVIGLLNRGGMKSMAGIVIIIYCGYTFASLISHMGFIQTFTAPMIKRATTPLKLIVCTLFTNFFIAACAGSSYAAFILSGEMYRDAYEKQGLGLNVLSRSMEDSGTMCMPLIPWGIAAGVYETSFGVSCLGTHLTDGYAVWAFNTYLNPIIAIVIAMLGVGLYGSKKTK
jgi:NhaC family Na+:H+ antiporter